VDNESDAALGGQSTETASSAHCKAERVFTEAYTCDAVLEEEEQIQSQPRNPEDSPTIEYVLAVLMLWSNSTHLANFGTASLWPVYLFFGSLSKYIRCKPTTFSAHHVAYLPSVRCISHLILL
jgi:hypothetical protein